MCRWVLCFFKQKTAYEMRISDWSSDVCSSDLDAIRDGLLSLMPGHSPDGLAGTMNQLLHDSGRPKPAGRRAAGAIRLRRGMRVRERSRQIGSASCRDRVCQYV